MSTNINFFKKPIHLLIVLGALTLIVVLIYYKINSANSNKPENKKEWITTLNDKENNLGSVDSYINIIDLTNKLLKKQDINEDDKKEVKKRKQNYQNLLLKATDGQVKKNKQKKAYKAAKELYARVKPYLDSLEQEKTEQTIRKISQLINLENHANLLAQTQVKDNKKDKINNPSKTNNSKSPPIVINKNPVVLYQQQFSDAKMLISKGEAAINSLSWEKAYKKLHKSLKLWECLIEKLERKGGRNNRLNKAKEQKDVVDNLLEEHKAEFGKFRNLRVDAPPC